MGAYDIVVGLGSLSATNYSFILTNGTLTVGKALLTVTADDQTRLYGQPDPVWTFHYSGFVDADTEGVLSGAPALSATADTNTTAGAYSIVVTNGSLVATNYALSFVNGALTINPAPLSVTADDASRPYGATNPVFAGTITGFVNGEDSNVLSGALTLASSAGATSPVAAYAIVPGGLTSANYSITYGNGVLTVTQTPLTVVAANQTRAYGQSSPAFTGTVSGVVNGDNITASYTSSATSASLAGTYSIVPSLNDPQNKLGNYSVTLTDGTLTITPVSNSPNPTNAPATNTSISEYAIQGIPPALSVTLTNGNRPLLGIFGTVGATVMVQSSTNMQNPDSWITITNLSVTTPASHVRTNSSAPSALTTAFVPAAQSYEVTDINPSPLQFYRVVMPYDYMVLADVVLWAQGYASRLVLVRMPGISSDDVCYVTPQSSFLFYDATNCAFALEPSGSTIRQIALTLSTSLGQNWTSASEFAYSNGVSTILATVVATEPASADPVAGASTPSIAIDF
jgi:hypothetical protein